MRKTALALALVLAPQMGVTEPADAVRDVVQAHVLPGYETLAQTSQALSDAAQQDCVPNSVPLRAAFGDAFDAWIMVSHLRFGPSETNDRAFALAFWPDPRGATPKALAELIAAEDPIAMSAEDYAEISIAARGFYALEFMLYDEQLNQDGTAAYRCQLVRTITADIATVTHAIHEEWQSGFAEQMLSPSDEGPYRTSEEALQALFGAVSTGLQFTSEARLGRPLGTFDRPRPKRAEARRSGRSAHHVGLSLTALRDLGMRLADGDPDLANTLDRAFEMAITRLTALDDPTFATIKDPQAYIRVEALQQAVERIRTTASQKLGPALGVSAGFNALDGD